MRPAGSHPLQRAVQREHQLLHQRVDDTELLDEFDRPTVVRALQRIIADVDVHGVQYAAEFDGQVLAGRVDEEAAGRDRTRLVQSEVATPDGHRSAAVQDDEVARGAVERGPVRLLALARHVHR